MKNYIITTRTENAWGEVLCDTFRLKAKTAGGAAAKARDIIFERLDGDLSGVKDITITKVSEV